jgi:hypothetical protein
MGADIMFALRLAIIKIEPPITSKTIHTPNARATMLFVLSDPKPICRKKMSTTRRILASSGSLEPPPQA